MTIEVINETDYSLDEAEFAALAEYVFDQMHIGSAVEMAILFVDEEEMERLHVRWLDLPGPTDVMSFPMDELQPGRPGRPVLVGNLGDIVICPSVAAAQAAHAGHSDIEEMLLLATHGMLHLLGYDHVSDEEERVMFDLQRKLLLTFLAQA